MPYLAFSEYFVIQEELKKSYHLLFTMLYCFIRCHLKYRCDLFAHHVIILDKTG